MSRLTTLLLSIVVVMPAVVGCSGPSMPPPAKLEHGLVLVLPGIAAGPTDTDTLVPTLRDSVLPWGISYYDWPGMVPGSAYALDQEMSREKAREIAGWIHDYRRDYPERPVFVVGHSGGAAIAVFVAEEINPDEPLAGLVVLATPLSPRYDLTRALAGAGGRMLSCYSPEDGLLDFLVLVGRNFDGTREKPAGEVGFELPGQADVRRVNAFRGLSQLRWDDTMRAYNHDGGHEGWTRPAWVRKFLVPRLLDWARLAGYRVETRPPDGP